MRIIDRDMNREVLELYLLGEVDDSAIEDFLLHDILSFRSTIHVRADQYERFDLDWLTPTECRQMFRFEKDDLIMLRRAVGIPDVVLAYPRYEVSGLEAFCMCLRRLSYPNRLCDLEKEFGLSSSYICAIVNRTTTMIQANKADRLINLQNVPGWSEAKLQTFAQATVARGAPVHNCVGFLDGTARAICRPSLNQEEYYSGHKRKHCVKYQSVITPDGIIVNLQGPFPGRRHDAGILGDTNLVAQLNQYAVFNNRRYTLYGDSAYPLLGCLLTPYIRRHSTADQMAFNRAMSSCRVAVEWGFQKVCTQFAFIDFRRNQKLMLQDLSTMYHTAVLLTNCHTCLYGSQTARYFDVEPPTLEEYLH